MNKCDSRINEDAWADVNYLARFCVSVIVMEDDAKVGGCAVCFTDMAWNVDWTVRILWYQFNILFSSGIIYIRLDGVIRKNVMRRIWYVVMRWWEWDQLMHS